MTILIFGIIFLLIIVSSSKAATRKDRWVDGVGKIAKHSGELLSDTGNLLKASSIESEVKKININTTFNVKYQEYGKVLLFTSKINYPLFETSDINDDLKQELFQKGIDNDFNLVKNISNSTPLYLLCKRREIQSILIWGCEIYPRNSATIKLKTQSVIKRFKVGSLGFEEVI